MELYTEKFVKKKLDNKELALKSLVVAAGGLIIYLAVMFLGLSLGQWALTVLVAASAVYFGWILFKRSGIEYDYSYCNGEFDIDIIYGESKRKDLCAFDVSDCERIGKYTRSADPATQRGYILKSYYALSSPDVKNAYYAIYTKNGRREMAVFEAEPEVVEDMKRRGKNIASGL